MSKLNNMAKVANLSIRIGTPVKVVRQEMEYKDMISRLEQLYVHVETLKNASELKSYLLENIEDLPSIEWTFEKPYILKAIEKLVSESDYFPEKLSSFEKEDFYTMVNCDGNPFILYLGLYLSRLGRKYEIDTPNTFSIATNISNIYGDSRSLFETVLKMDEKDLIPLFFVKNFRIDENKFVDTMKLLKEYHYSGLVNYLTGYNTVSSEELIGVDCKNALRLINRIYFKVRNWLPKNYENYLFGRVLSMASETKYDIKYLNGFYNNVTADFFNRDINIVSYLNVCLGDKYAEFIENAPDVSAFKSLLIYALKNKKFAFLKVMEENLEFLTNNTYALNKCLLTRQDVYTRYLNLNEINAKDLKDMVLTESVSIDVMDIKNNFIKLTPKEVVVLARAPKMLQNLYGLLETKIDNKLIILRQLLNTEVPTTYKEREIAFRVARKLSMRNLSQWRNYYDFEVSGETLLSILSLEEKYDNIIAESKNELELQFIYRNRETINLEVSLEENFKYFMENDLDCKRMFEIMELTPAFLESNKKGIERFCLAGNATIVVTYYNGGNISDKQKTAMLRAAKAEMADEMERFKFFDLEKELEYKLSSEESDIWKNNCTKSSGSIFAYETYSFSDTMLIGVKPDHTCMNYKDGMYRECLLANFDANKKILFAKLNGKIVARAIIRLTKSLKKDEKEKKGVSFLDVEHDTCETNSNGANERLTIFLERFYSSHIDGNMTRQIRSMFVEMLKEKSKEMGARLLTSCDYGDCNSSLKSTTMKVFISHTKNGVQYMDSFGGSKNTQEEASYSACSCYKI